jgi:hypothetical protein
VKLTGVGDAEDTAAEELTAGSTELDVVATEVVDVGLAEHGVVLDLRLAERGDVGGDDDELGLAVPEGLQGLLDAHDVLAGLHHKLKPAVDRLDGLLGLLLHHFDVSFSRVDREDAAKSEEEEKAQSMKQTLQGSGKQIREAKETKTCTGRCTCATGADASMPP